MSPEIRPYFHDLIRAFTNWQPMSYGLPPRHFGKAVVTPRKNAPKAEHPHEPPGPPKNYGADINTLIKLLESGRL